MAMATVSASDWKRNDDSAHDVVELEIAPGAVRVLVVAIDAGLRDGAIGIDRLKQAHFAAPDDAIVRLRRVMLHFGQSHSFEIAVRAVPSIDRRQTSQAEGKAEILDGHQPSGFQEELS